MYGFEVSVIRMIIKEKNKTTIPETKTTISKTNKTTLPKNNEKTKNINTEIELINFE